MGTWPVNLAPESSWRWQLAQDPCAVRDGALKLYTLPACVEGGFRGFKTIFSIFPMKMWIVNGRPFSANLPGCQYRPIGISRAYLS